ncbi:MAG: serine hydrolase, partial [Bacteroidota bacterium]
QKTSFLPNDTLIFNKATAYKNGEEISWEQNKKEFGAAYGIHSEAVDFAKWLCALVNKEGLQSSSFEELFRAQFPLPEDDPQRAVGITDWTLGFAKAEIAGKTLYAHGGNNPGFSSLFVIEPISKWGFVIFANADQVTEFEYLLFLWMNGLGS